MHQHHQNEEEVFRKARKNLTNTILKMLGFGGGFCLALIYVIVEGSSAFFIVAHPSIRYAGAAGPSVPIIIVLALTGLGTLLGIPDLKQSWREYQQARQRHIAAKLNLTSPDSRRTDKL